MNTLRRYALNALIFLTPLWFSTTTLQNAMFESQVVFVQALTLIIVALFQSNRVIGAFLLLTGAHYFIFDDHAYFSEVATAIGCAAVIYQVVSQNPGFVAYRKIVVALLAWSLGLSCLQWAGADILFWQNMEPSGMWTLPSYMGIFAAVTLPVVWAWCPWLIALNIACLLLSKSAFAVVAAVAGMGVFVPRRSRKAVVACALIFAVAGVFVAADKKEGEWARRLNVWPMVLSTAFRHPFFGWGAGNYQEWLFIEFRGRQNHYFQATTNPKTVTLAQNEEAVKAEILRIAAQEGTDTSRIEALHFKERGAPFRNMKWIMDDLRGKAENPLHGYVFNHPHSEYLMIFFQWGAAGPFLFWLYLRELWRDFVRIVEPEKELLGLAGAVLATLVAAIGHFPFYVPRLAIPILFLFAIFAGKMKERLSAQGFFS